MTERRVPAIVALLTAIFAMASPGAAQDVTAARPLAGVFGGTATDDATHSLTGIVSLSGGYEDNGIETDSTDAESVFTRSGGSSGLDASLSYTRRGAMQLGLIGGSSLKYFTSDQRAVRLNDHLSAGIATGLGRRVRVFANQSVSCGPLHFLGLFPSAGGDPVPGASAAVGASYSLDDARACALSSGANISVAVGARSSVSFSSGLRHTMYEAGSPYTPFNAVSVGGQFLTSITRNLRLRAGYTRREGEYRLGVGGPPVTLHDIDLGVDYVRPLSLTRRTYLEFKPGSTIVSVPPTVTAEQRLEYRVIGEATLNHEFRRTWRARLGYNRGVSFVEGLDGPALSDGVIASLTGFLSRRIDLSASAAVTTGIVGAAVDGGEFTSYTGSARMRFALSRAWALHTEYTHYSHRLPADHVLFNVPLSMERSVAHVGLTVWLPLLKR